MTAPSIFDIGGNQAGSSIVALLLLTILTLPWASILT
jgi:hypothetical protein